MKKYEIRKNSKVIKTFDNKKNALVYYYMHKLFSKQLSVWEIKTTDGTIVGKNITYKAR